MYWMMTMMMMALMCILDNKLKVQKIKSINYYSENLPQIINYNKNIRIDYLRCASEPKSIKSAPSESAVAVPTKKQHITEEKIQ